MCTSSGHLHHSHPFWRCSACEALTQEDGTGPQNRFLASHSPGSSKVKVIMKMGLFYLSHYGTEAQAPVRSATPSEKATPAPNSSRLELPNAGDPSRPKGSTVGATRKLDETVKQQASNETGTRKKCTTPNEHMAFSLLVKDGEGIFETLMVLWYPAAVLVPESVQCCPMAHSVFCCHFCKDRHDRVVFNTALQAQLSSHHKLLWLFLYMHWYFDGWEPVETGHVSLGRGQKCGGHNRTL